MPSALTVTSGTCLLSLLTCFLLSAAPGPWPSWTALTEVAGETLPIVASNRHFRAPSASVTHPAVRSVSIPSLPMPLTDVTASGTDQTAVRSPSMPDGPIPGVLRTPAGAGPFPAVILLHGCGGPFAGIPDWAYRLNAWGYAVLMPDSLTPRGTRTVCGPEAQQKVTPGDRVGDVGAAAAWLRSRPEIDPNRIAVLGLSRGGATAALATRAEYAGMRLRAAIDYHGPCGDVAPGGTVPLLVVANEADDMVMRCHAQTGQPFEPYTVTEMIHARHPAAYDRAAAEDSFARVRMFLDREVLENGSDRKQETE